MTRDEILTHIATDRIVEKLISKICSDTPQREDLSQYIYLKLAELDSNRLEAMEDTGSLIYYIVRMITNQVFSGSSNYYKYYTWWEQKKCSIDEFKEDIRGV